MYTVKELIETLKKCPQDFKVNVRNNDYFTEWDIVVVGIDHGKKTVELFTD